MISALRKIVTFSFWLHGPYSRSRDIEKRKSERERMRDGVRTESIYGRKSDKIHKPSPKKRNSFRFILSGLSGALHSQLKIKLLLCKTPNKHKRYNSMVGYLYAEGKRNLISAKRK